MLDASRGGYNALQALTHDPAINDRDAHFDFGFGVAEAGYSSLLTILHNTNTESPEIIATGDPRTEEGRRRLRERSPLDNVHRLDAPLLLMHGTNDFRVQIEESRRLLEAARRLGKHVRLVEFPGAALLESVLDPVHRHAGGDQRCARYDAVLLRRDVADARVAFSYGEARAARRWLNRDRRSWAGRGISAGRPARVASDGA